MLLLSLFCSLIYCSDAFGQLHSFTIVSGSSFVNGTLNGYGSTSYNDGGSFVNLTPTNIGVPNHTGFMPNPADPTTVDYACSTAGMTDGRSYAIAKAKSETTGWTYAEGKANQTTKKTNFTTGPATAWFFAHINAPNTHSGLYDLGGSSKSRTDVKNDTIVIEVFHNPSSAPRWLWTLQMNGQTNTYPFSSATMGVPGPNNVNFYLVKQYATASLSNADDVASNSRAFIANDGGPNLAQTTADVAVQ